MALFGLFDPLPPHLKKAAQSLPVVATTLAVGTFVPAVDRYPVLRSVDTERWDFLIAVATIHAALERLKALPIRPAHKRKAHDLVLSRLAHWHPHGSAALADCTAYCSKATTALEALPEFGTNRGNARIYATGSWLLANLIEASLHTEAIRQMTGPLGGIADRAASDFWNAFPASTGRLSNRDEPESRAADEPEPHTVPVGWLQRQLTLDEFSSEIARDGDSATTYRDGFLSPLGLFRRLRPGDEVWQYASPGPPPGGRICKRVGFALVRGGLVVDSTETTRLYLRSND